MSTPALLVVLGLSGCVEPTPPAVLPVERAAAPIVLEVGTLYAGFEGVLRVRGLDPGVQALLGVSGRGAGRGPCPALPGGGPCWGIRNPSVLGTRAAGADGGASWRAEVPRDASGTYSFQAAGHASGVPVLSGVVEVRVVPYGRDSDGDGVRDGLEVREGTDPTRADTDGDGLDDGREAWETGTDPRVRDTDGDGLWDGAEVDAHGSDPLSGDGDRDGALDPVEVARGTDPLRRDTDGDGQLDGDDLYPLAPDVPDPWVPQDTLASGRLASVHDAEFDETTGRVVWQPVSGSELWLAELDHGTGRLVPLDGKGVRLDRDVAPLGVGFNGAEWMIDASGSQVVYAKRDAGELVLWRAWESGGRWRSGMMPGRTPGVVPLGSKAPGQPDGRVLFHQGDEADPRPLWREVADGSTVTPLPEALWSIDPRWMQNGERVLAGTAVLGAGGWRQAWVHDIDTGTWEVVTDDPAHKYEPWVTRAPELGGDRVMAVLRGAEEGAYTEVLVLHETPAGWEELRVLPTPGRHPYAVSPEVFVAEGRTWVTWQASTGAAWNDITEGSIWFASIDPAEGVLRRLSASGPMVRKDPEPYVAGPRPWVFYTEVVLSDLQRILHRCELGLTP